MVGCARRCPRRRVRRLARPECTARGVTRHRTLLAASAAAAVAAGIVLWLGPPLSAAPSLTDTTVYACRTKTVGLNQVRFDTPAPCASGQRPVQWQGQVGRVVGGSPSPMPTTTTATPTPTSPPGAWNCTATGFGAGCDYEYPKINTGSSVYTTHINTDCWANPSCDSKLEANSPGDWQVTTTEPAGNTSVRTYPDVQQLMTNWCPAAKDWSGCTGASSPTPRQALASLTSSYAETMNETAGTKAQAAWDLWTSSGELMIWVDEVGRGSGGATQCGSGTLSGRAFTYYLYGGNGCTPATGDVPIIKLDVNARTADIDLLAALDYFTSVGQFTSNGDISQINFGWEVCSTGGVPQTFRMTDYSLTAVVA